MRKIMIWTNNLPESDEKEKKETDGKDQQQDQSELHVWYDAHRQCQIVQ